MLLKAAVEWLKIEQQGVAQQIGARDDFSVATEEELVNFILGYLTSARLVTSVETQLRERSSHPPGVCTPAPSGIRNP